MGVLVTLAAVVLVAVLLALLGYRLLVSGALGLDTGRGRRIRPLGPQVVSIDAPRATVYDLLSQPYLGRATRAVQEKVRVIERGSDLVLAAHYTPVRGNRTAVTVETVRFSPPERIDFRLVRGPVPHVVEHFLLTAESPQTTRLEYGGELGSDGWALGRMVGPAGRRQVGGDRRRQPRRGQG